MSPLRFLEHKNELYQKILETIEDLVAVVDLRAHYLYVSPSHEKVLGYKPEELVGKSGLKLFHPKDQATIRKKMLQCLTLRRTVSSTARFKHKNGEWVVLEGIGSPIVNKLGLPEMILVTSRDVTEQKKMEDTIRHLALHDHLTGLPNRLLLEDRAELAFRAAKRNRCKVGCIFMDLDNFKDVNDNFGHAAGDKVLVEVGKRLNHCMRVEDTVARLGGDEFTIIVPDITSLEDAMKVANKVRRYLRQPIKVEGEQVSLTASMGISIYPDQGTTAKSLFQKADHALYEVKQEAGNAHRAYVNKTKSKKKDSLALARPARAGKKSTH